MRKLLLVSHRSIDQVGGATARWRAFQRYLPEHGWQVEVVSAPERASGVEFTADPAAQRRVATRARVMAQVGRAADPVAALLGVRPEALPPSMAWSVTGARQVRERIAASRPDVVLATAPPMAAVMAARRALGAGAPPFVAEMRDLWAGSPAFDRRGGLLTRAERWAFDRAAAIVVMSPEAAQEVGARHPALAARIREIPNGFDPVLLGRGPGERGQTPLTLIHSGTLTGGRPPGPLLDVLGREPYRSRFRLVLHGYATPDVAAAVTKADPGIVELVPPSDWEDATARIAAADVGVVLQGASVGDATAVASKVFEYLVLGKPVLTVTDGGATEGLLRRLGAGQLAARLDDPASIAAALDRLLEGVPATPAPDALARYDRRRLAGEMAALLDDVASATSPGE